MANKSKKINYFAPGFIIPMVYSTVSGIILILAYLLAKNPQMFDLGQRGHFRSMQ